MAPFQHATIRDIAAGEYDWGSPTCIKATATRAGAIKALMLSLEDDHPDVTEKEVGELYDSEYQRLLTEGVRRITADPPG